MVGTGPRGHLLAGHLEEGGSVLLDGAMGTELQRLGVPLQRAAWSAAALVTHPDTVRQIHEDYIRAGADVITTNTFSTARHTLEAGGMGDRVGELNVLAVRLARDAVESIAEDKPVLVAGSISSFLATGKNPGQLEALTVAQARANYQEQAELLAEAGADLLILEMMRDVEQTTYVLEAALSMGLPVWIGFSCRMGRDGTTVELLNGEPGHTFGGDLEVILSAGGSVVSVMHTDVGDTAAALQVVREKWQGPAGAYSHSGEFVMPDWQFGNVISPEEYLVHAQEWEGMGVQVVGACCGMGPDHIRLLRERLG